MTVAALNDRIIIIKASLFNYLCMAASAKKAFIFPFGFGELIPAIKTELDKSRIVSTFEKINLWRFIFSNGRFCDSLLSDGFLLN